MRITLAGHCLRCDRLTVGHHRIHKPANLPEYPQHARRIPEAHIPPRDDHFDTGGFQERRQQNAAVVKEQMRDTDAAAPQVPARRMQLSTSSRDSPDCRMFRHSTGIGHSPESVYGEDRKTASVHSQPAPFRAVPRRVNCRSVPARAWTRRSATRTIFCSAAAHAPCLGCHRTCLCPLKKRKKATPEAAFTSTKYHGNAQIRESENPRPPATASR